MHFEHCWREGERERGREIGREGGRREVRVAEELLPVKVKRKNVNSKEAPSYFLYSVSEFSCIRIRIHSMM